MELHRAWGCHKCGCLSSKILLTPCGCPYHEDCLPARCDVHDLPINSFEETAVPICKLYSRRELLREIQAAGLRGLRVEKLLLKTLLSDLYHLASKDLIIFSPHQTTVFDARLVCPTKDT